MSKKYFLITAIGFGLSFSAQSAELRPGYARSVTRVKALTGSVTVTLESRLSVGAAVVKSGGVIKGLKDISVKVGSCESGTNLVDTEGSSFMSRASHACKVLMHATKGRPITAKWSADSMAKAGKIEKVIVSFGPQVVYANGTYSEKKIGGKVYVEAKFTVPTYTSKSGSYPTKGRVGLWMGAAGRSASIMARAEAFQEPIEITALIPVTGR